MMGEKGQKKGSSILKYYVSTSKTACCCRPQIKEIKWADVGGWTGQGGSLLGTKRWSLKQIINPVLIIKKNLCWLMIMLLFPFQNSSCKARWKNCRTDAKSQHKCTASYRWIRGTFKTPLSLSSCLTLYLLIKLHSLLLLSISLLALLVCK